MAQDTRQMVSESWQLANLVRSVSTMLDRASEQALSALSYCTLPTQKESRPRIGRPSL